MKKTLFDFLLFGTSFSLLILIVAVAESVIDLAVIYYLWKFMEIFLVDFTSEFFSML